MLFCLAEIGGIFLILVLSLVFGTSQTGKIVHQFGQNVHVFWENESLLLKYGVKLLGFSTAFLFPRPPEAIAS